MELGSGWSEADGRSWGEGGVKQMRGVGSG